MIIFSISGMSWHITVVESLAPSSETNQTDPMIKTDYYVSLMESQCKQDPEAVGAITREVLLLHKKNNPHMREYWLRSDQASCYKSDRLMIPLWSMNETGELGNAKIKGYIFSEAGAGKSKCDQVCFLKLSFVSNLKFIFLRCPP